jgi:uncharacterized protein YyaL (SSP411 family)
VTHDWRRALDRSYRPEVTIVDTAGETVPDALQKGRFTTTAAAFVCRGMTCLPPVATLDAIEAALVVP